MRRTRAIRYWVVLAASAVLGAVVLVPFWPAAPGDTQAGSPQSTLGNHDAADRNDCGPATLYCICKLDGKDYSLKRLRELAKTSSSGTTMLDLKRAAERVGFHVDARNGPWRELQRHVRSAGSYAIVHTIGERGGHFVGVVGASDERIIRVVDVVRGAQDLDQQGFLTAYDWRGHMLLLSTNEPSGSK